MQKENVRVPMHHSCEEEKFQGHRNGQNPSHVHKTEIPQRLEDTYEVFILCQSNNKVSVQELLEINLTLCTQWIQMLIQMRATQMRMKLI